MRIYLFFNKIKNIPISPFNLPMKTVVINLNGGPGVGKSTLSADLFAKLKLNKKLSELAGEYVKNWVYKGHSINQWDQIYILGKQISRESLLYGKTEFIIADSPILLVPFYEQYLFNHEIVLPAAKNFIKYAEKEGVKYLNFWLERPDSNFEAEGRNQGESEAKIIDQKMREWLIKNGINLINLPKDHNSRINIIFKELGLTPPY